MRILRPSCTHVSGLYRRIPSAWGDEGKERKGEYQAVMSRPQISGRVARPFVPSSSSLHQRLGPKAGIKCAAWQFFSDFTGSTSGFTIRKSALISRMLFPTSGGNSARARPDAEIGRRPRRRESRGYLERNICYRAKTLADELAD